MSLTDRIIFSTPALKVGVFRCSCDDPKFVDSGPSENHEIVFPRTGVWICHDGSQPFVADASIATVYNRGQHYTRMPLCQDGDRSDYFAMSPALALEMADDTIPVGERDPDHPFDTEFLPVPPRVYAMQRRVLGLIERGAESSQIEELALTVIAAMFRNQRGPRRTATGARARAAHRDLAMMARAALAQRLFEPLDLTTMAATLGVSPWHLCRVFKEQTGSTIHGYRRDLRLRTALEHLEPAAGGISMLAHQLGFSSHSHFTAAFRGRFGFTPAEGRTLASVGGLWGGGAGHAWESSWGRGCALSRDCSKRHRTA